MYVGDDFDELSQVKLSILRVGRSPYPSDFTTNVRRRRLGVAQTSTSVSSYRYMPLDEKSKPKNSSRRSFSCFTAAVHNQVR